MIGAHRNLKGGFDVRRNETPLRRENPSGKVRFMARYTGEDGKTRSAGTFAKEGPCREPRDDGACCAQHAIWAAYERGQPKEKGLTTVREYFEGDWLRRHPRSERTEANYRSRMGAVLDVRTQDGVFGELPVLRVRPRHLDDLVDVMLVRHGRSLSGTRAVLAVLRSFFMDAIRDEIAETNPAMVIQLRDRDPRIQRAKREPVLCSWDEMHRFAMLAGDHEPMVRVLSDCGLRLGEMLGLECKHAGGDVLVVEQHAWNGVIVPGTKQGARREVPLPPRLGSLLALARRDRIGLLFPGPSGVWSETQFYRRVWKPARVASGLAINPHDLRHSYVSLMRAAGVDPADLATASGHTVETATSVYTHATGATFDLMREAVGL